MACGLFCKRQPSLDLAQWRYDTLVRGALLYPFDPNLAAEPERFRERFNNLVEQGNAAK